MYSNRVFSSINTPSYRFLPSRFACLHFERTPTFFHYGHIPSSCTKCNCLDVIRWVVQTKELLIVKPSAPLICIPFATKIRLGITFKNAQSCFPLLMKRPMFTAIQPSTKLKCILPGNSCPVTDLLHSNWTDGISLLFCLNSLALPGIKHWIYVSYHTFLPLGFIPVFQLNSIMRRVIKLPPELWYLLSLLHFVVSILNWNNWIARALKSSFDLCGQSRGNKVFNFNKWILCSNKT